MNIRIKFLLGFLFAMLNPAWSMGQDKVLTATCSMGEGCHFQLTDLTAAEADVVLGKDGFLTKAPAGSMLVVDETPGANPKFYIESNKTRSQLDEQFGGDGFTQIHLFAAGIQPNDGAWTIRVGEPVSSPCFVNVQGVLAGATSGFTKSGEIQFTKPFQARQLMNHSDVRWFSTGKNKYTAQFAFNQAPMNMVYQFEVKNANRIDGEMKLTVKVPGQSPCYFRIPVTYQCVKPKSKGRGRTPNVPILTDPPKPNVPRLEDPPKPNVPILEDPPKPNVPRLEDPPKPNVPRLEDKTFTDIEILD